MDIRAAENDIVSKLSTDISGVKIQAFPDNADFYKLLHPKAAILVRYGGSFFDDAIPNKNKETNQRRVLEWYCTILSRNIHSHDDGQGKGIYDLIEDVRESLSGYTVNSLTQSEVMRPVSDRFIAHRDGVWEHEIVFQHAIPEVEDFQT